VTGVQTCALPISDIYVAIEEAKKKQPKSTVPKHGSKT